MKKKEYKKIVLENIDHINVSDELRDYSNNTIYPEQKKPMFNFKKIGMIFASVAILFVGIYSIVDGSIGSIVFDDPMAESSNPSNEEVVLGIDGFIEYYNSISMEKPNERLTVEMLENIYNDFNAKISVQEVIEKYCIENQREKIELLYEFYQKNLN